MFIIDGADDLGKTTLAKQIVAECNRQEILPVHYAHMSRPGPAFDFCHHYRDMMSVYGVQDRFHLGALVWHNHVMDKEDFQLVEGWLASLGSQMVVLFSSNTEWYRQRLEASTRSQMFGVDKLLKANEWYGRLAEEHSRLILDVWDVADGDWPDEHVVKGWIKSWMSALKKLDPPKIPGHSKMAKFKGLLT